MNVNKIMTQEKFEGFNFEPNTWNFPMCINGWINKLTGNEFKVLWYILRHTYGWHKDKDKISFKQFRFGIKKKDGVWLDKGTGLGTASLKSAIKGLVDKSFIETKQERNTEGKFSIVEYKPKYKNPPTDSPSADKCPLQVVSSKTITNSKQPIIRTTTILAEQSSAGKKINNLIDLFKNINPSYEKFFSNKTQRGALERLCEKMGEDKLEECLKVLPKTNQMKYAPTITTPLQLEDKIGSLMVFINKEKKSNAIAI